MRWYSLNSWRNLLCVGRLKVKYRRYLEVSRLYLGPRCDIRIVDEGTLYIGYRVSMEAETSIICVGGHVSIGAHCWFNRNCYINSYNQIAIGERCLFGPNVGVFDADHVFSDPTQPIKSQGFESKPILIGSDVWLGANVVVTKGVIIGDHVVVGANSVVTESLASYGVYCGTPARLVKKIRPDSAAKSATPMSLV